MPGEEGSLKAENRALKAENKALKLKIRELEHVLNGVKVAKLLTDQTVPKETHEPSPPAGGVHT